MKWDEVDWEERLWTLAAMRTKQGRPRQIPLSDWAPSAQTPARAMDPAKVAQMVEVLNGLTARDALCLLAGCMLTVLNEAPSDE
jgi:hypothetical protein